LLTVSNFRRRFVQCLSWSDPGPAIFLKQLKRRFE
jgi:hypothetical protein